MTRRYIRCAVAILASAAVAACAGRSPERAEALGDHYLSVEQYDRAAENYAFVVNEWPWRYEAHLGLGKALIGSGHADQARTHLEIAYTQRPNDPEAVETLAEAMFQSGDKAGMSRFLSKRAQERQTVEDWMRFGRFAQRAGDLDDARRAYLNAAKLDKGMTVEPQLALADLYEEAGDRENALRRLRMALFLAPQNAAINERIRAFGETPGLTYALQPEEAE